MYLLSLVLLYVSAPLMVKRICFRNAQQFAEAERLNLSLEEVRALAAGPSHMRQLMQDEQRGAGAPSASAAAHRNKRDADRAAADELRQRLAAQRNAPRNERVEPTPRLEEPTARLEEPIPRVELEGPRVDHEAAAPRREVPRVERKGPRAAPEPARAAAADQSDDEVEVQGLALIGRRARTPFVFSVRDNLRNSFVVVELRLLLVVLSLAHVLAEFWEPIREKLAEYIRPGRHYKMHVALLAEFKRFDDAGNRVIKPWTLSTKALPFE